MKNSLHSSRVQECLLNKLFLFALSFRAVISYYLISFWPIAALQVAAIKNVSLLLISSSSRPDSLCFGFDLNQSQRTMLIS